MKKLMTLSTALTLAATSSCTSVNNTPAANIPTHETVVLTAKTTMNGSILPKSTGEQTVFTRPTERRIDDKINYSSWFARKFFTNSDRSLIGATEKNRSWGLNNTTKTYAECPLYGCGPNLWQLLPKNQEGSDEPLTELNTPQTCQLTTSAHYDVTDMKVSRVVNGFNANQYQLVWTIENKDLQGKIDSHKLVMDFWMTAPTEAMQKAWKINGEFQQNYLQAVGANDTPLGRMLGQQVYMALAAVSGDTEKNPQITALNGKLAALSGYPVSIKLEWFASSEACKNEKKTTEEPKPAKFDLNIAAGTLHNMTRDILKEGTKVIKNDIAAKVAPNPKEPVLSYSYDVQTVAISQEKDTLFSVPGNYKQVTEK